MAISASEPRQGITQRSHRARHRPRSREVRRAVGVGLFGVAVTVAGLADPDVDGPVALVIGVAIILIGVTLLVAALPASTRYQPAPAQVRSTADGVVLEGETMDTTVPWDQFERLTGELRGATLEVRLERTAGDPLPVPALTRRSLLSEGARERAIAEVERLNIRLRAEKPRR